MIKNNPTFNLPINQRYLVEKKEPTLEDNGWYNLYSDGWCEQGGYFTVTNYSTPKQVNNYKTYTICTYVSVTPLVGTYTSNTEANGVISNITNSSFIFTSGDAYASSGYYYWISNGYVSTTKSQSIIKY